MNKISVSPGIQWTPSPFDKDGEYAIANAYGQTWGVPTRNLTPYDLRAMADHLEGVRERDLSTEEVAGQARMMRAAPDMLEALKAAVIPLMRLGDFIGNEDAGGASGLGPFDRCAILSQVRAAIEKAEGSK